MKKTNLTIKVMNPPSEDDKEKMIKILTQVIQDTYYS